MAAVGLDGLLIDGGPEGLSLTTTADALVVKTSAEAVDGLDSSEGNVSQLRLGPEAARAFPLANGASLLPALRLAIRQDQGDAETGFGMELGTGLSWMDREQGISAELRGRTLLTHADNDVEEHDLAVSFAWDPDGSNRGPSLSLSHSMGSMAAGGVDALLNATAIQVPDGDSPSVQEEFATQLAYGFPALGDRLILTPGLELALSRESTVYSLLWSLAPYAEQAQAHPWQVSLEGERQQSSSTTSAEHSLGLRFSLLF